MAMDMKAFEKVAGRINPGMSTDYTAAIVAELRELWVSHKCPEAPVVVPVAPTPAKEPEAPKAPARHEPTRLESKVAGRDLHDQTEEEALALAELGE